MEFAFVDVDNLVEVKATQLADVQVYLPLFLMSWEWAGNSPPQTLVIDERLSIDRLVRMCFQDIRRLEAQRPGPDRLEFQEGLMPGNSSVGASRNQEFGGCIEWYLIVGYMRAPAIRALTPVNPEPYIHTLLTFPPAPQFSHFLKPGLPLMVDLMAVLEDVQALESERLLDELTARPEVLDPEVRGPGAPVSMGHLAGMDDVLPAGEIPGLLAQYVQLHWADDQRVIELTGVGQGFQAASRA